MKKRFIILFKLIAWAPTLILCLLLFVPVWLFTGQLTTTWFEGFHEGIIPYEGFAFSPPPPPTADKDYPDFNTNDCDGIADRQMRPQEGD